MATSTSNERFARKHLSALSKITMATMLISALCLVALKIITGIGNTQTIAVILAVAALLIVTRVRWLPLVGSLISGFLLFVLLFMLHFVVEVLTHPQYAMKPIEVPVIVILLVSLAVSLVTGIVATVKNYI